MDILNISKNINKNTILIVGSTPSYNLGIIDTIWEDDMDGRIALLEAVEAMNRAKMENLKFSEMDIVRSIEKYNYVDVKVIDEIITFLRTKI